MQKNKPRCLSWLGGQTHCRQATTAGRKEALKSREVQIGGDCMTFPQHLDTTTLVFIPHIKCNRKNTPMVMLFHVNLENTSPAVVTSIVSSLALGLLSPHHAWRKAPTECNPGFLAEVGICSQTSTVLGWRDSSVNKMLASKHEGPSLILRTYIKKPGLVVYICNPSPRFGETETGDL